MFYNNSHIKQTVQCSHVKEHISYILWMKQVRNDPEERNVQHLVLIHFAIKVFI